VIAGDDGTFSQDAQLQKDDNVFTAVGINDTNQKSPVSDGYTIRFLTGNPKLDVSSPKDGDVLYNTPATIIGQTDPGDSITVNDRLAIVDSSGKFSFSLNLNSGDNKVKVVTTDPAGNQTTKELTIKYQG